MPIIFENFIPKCRNHNPRSEAPARPWARSSAASLSDFEIPRIPSLTVMQGQRNFLSATGEINVPVESPSSFLLQSPTLDTPPGLHGTTRFFVTIAKSKSLVDEARISAKPSDSVCGLRSSGRESRVKERSDSVAVPTYSRDPHEEFRRSMEEMVRSRLEQNLAVDWDYLVELVMCYVEMNEKEARKYILKAFVDVVVPLRQFHGDAPARSLKNKASSVRTVRSKSAIA